ncbi:MAG: monovalent cation/H+ antiporter complex subunit F [bacterium]
MDTFISILIMIQSIGIVLCLLRLFRGPTLAERTVAGDGVVFMIMGILILISIKNQTTIYLDAVLIIALLGFISTLTVARYLELNDDND